MRYRDRFPNLAPGVTPADVAPEPFEEPEDPDQAFEARREARL